MSIEFRPSGLGSWENHSSSRGPKHRRPFLLAVQVAPPVPSPPCSACQQHPFHGLWLRVPAKSTIAASELY